MPPPIGISFLPSDDQAANGPMQGNAEGDLGQALKILSLHLPRVLGSRPIASKRLLTNPGGFNPAAAVIQAILAAGGMHGGASAGGGGYDVNGADPTRVRPGGGQPPAGSSFVDRSNSQGGGDTMPSNPWSVNGGGYLPTPHSPVSSGPFVDRSQNGGDAGMMPANPWSARRQGY